MELILRKKVEDGEIVCKIFKVKKAKVECLYWAETTGAGWEINSNSKRKTRIFTADIDGHISTETNWTTTMPVEEVNYIFDVDVVLLQKLELLSK